MKQGSSNSYYRCFEVLANPLRMRIISELQRKPKSVQEIVDLLNEEQSKVSHALSILRKCKFIEAERKGKQKVYSLSTNFKGLKISGSLLDAIAHYRQKVCRICERN